MTLSIFVGYQAIEGHKDGFCAIESVRFEKGVLKAVERFNF